MLWHTYHSNFEYCFWGTERQNTINTYRYQNERLDVTFPKIGLFLFLDENWPRYGCVNVDSKNRNFSGFLPSIASTSTKCLRHLEAKYFDSVAMIKKRLDLLVPNILVFFFYDENWPRYGCSNIDDKIGLFPIFISTLILFLRHLEAKWY